MELLECVPGHAEANFFNDDRRVGDLERVNDGFDVAWPGGVAARAFRHDGFLHGVDVDLEGVGLEGVDNSGGVVGCGVGTEVCPHGAVRVAVAEDAEGGEGVGFAQEDGHGAGGDGDSGACRGFGEDAVDSCGEFGSSGHPVDVERQSPVQRLCCVHAAARVSTAAIRRDVGGNISLTWVYSGQGVVEDADVVPRTICRVTPGRAG